MESLARGAEFVAIWLFAWEVVVAALYRGAGFDRALSGVIDVVVAAAAAGSWGRLRLNRAHR